MGKTLLRGLAIPTVFAVATLFLAHLLLMPGSILDLAHGLTDPLYLALEAGGVSSAVWIVAIVAAASMGKTFSPTIEQVAVYTAPLLACAVVAYEFWTKSEIWSEALRDDRVDLYPEWLSAYLLVIACGFGMAALVRVVSIVAARRTRRGDQRS